MTKNEAEEKGQSERFSEEESKGKGKKEIEEEGEEESEEDSEEESEENSEEESEEESDSHSEAESWTIGKLRELKQKSKAAEEKRERIAIRKGKSRSRRWKIQ
jgi:hypothetical protein